MNFVFFAVSRKTNKDKYLRYVRRLELLLGIRGRSFRCEIQLVVVTVGVVSDLLCTFRYDVSFWPWGSILYL